MFLFSVLTVALLPAPTPHNQQIFTLTGGTHETPNLNDHQDDDIIQYTTMMEQNNECACFTEHMLVNILFNCCKFNFYFGF